MTAGPWSAPGSRVLAFLSPRDEAPWPTTGIPDSAPDDAWVAAPGSSSHSDPGQGAIALDPKAPPIVTRDFRVLRGPAEVLAAARAAAAAAPADAAGAYGMDATMDSAAAELLYAGSAVIVRVPVDTKLVAQALVWVRSDEVGERVRAAEIFGAVPRDALHRILKGLIVDPGAFVDQLLRGLLEDPGVWVQRGSDGRPDEHLYPVRRAARDALNARGVTVGDVVITEPAPVEDPDAR